MNPMGSRKKLQASDLDRTLLPSGSWPEDPRANELVNELIEKNGVHGVYVTGRNLAFSEDAIRENTILFARSVSITFCFTMPYLCIRPH
jgi:hydroxymethylpyrimidine pyrophosphatase-like HAD family hydrolase